MSEETQRTVKVPRYNWITRPTVVLPGSRGTISGTAINDWIGEDGQSIYSRVKVDGDASGDADGGESAV